MDGHIFSFYNPAWFSFLVITRKKRNIAEEKENLGAF